MIELLKNGRLPIANLQLMLNFIFFVVGSMNSEHVAISPHVFLVCHLL